MPKDMQDRYCWRQGCYVHAVVKTGKGWWCPDHTPVPWTDERTETLTRLWADGVSAAKIAKHLGGVTREAVIGKTHRLGLARSGAGRGNSPRREQSHLNQRVPKKPAAAPRGFQKGGWGGAPAAPKAPLTIKTAGPTAASLNLRIMDDGFGGCRWPTVVGEDGVQRFCCVPAGEATYCAAHARKAYQGGKVVSESVAKDMRRYA